MDASGVSPRKSRGCGSTAIKTAMMIRIQISTGTLRKIST